MKKVLFSIAAAALALTSCVKENVEVAQDYVTFEVAVEDVATRAIGDGNTCDELVYEVYDANGAKVIALSKTTTITNGKATVTIPLAKGQTYSFAFWAQVAGTGYYTTTDLKAIKINYDSVNDKANAENRDAFFAYVANVASTTVPQTVYLKRPFAQLNLAVSDLQASKDAGIELKQVKVVTEAATMLDLTTGAATEATDITYNLAGVLAKETLTLVDGSSYDWFSMNYILPAVEDGDSRTTQKVEFTLTTNHAPIVFTSNNTPVQRNWRTNLIAKLTEENSFEVVIDPKFENEIVLPTEPVKENEEGVYEISNERQLLWLAEQVNANNTFDGKTVKLAADIDLAGIEWTPIGNVVSYPSTTFAGTFDGQEHVISNLTAAAAGDGGVAAAGLFGSITGEVQNVTLKNVNVTSTHYAGALVGYSSTNVGMKISNCHVDGGTITSAAEPVGEGKYGNGDKVGGVIGYMAAGDVVTGCTVKNVKIQGYRDLGGIVGYAAGTVENCSIENVTITVDAAHNYEEYTDPAQYDANSIVGENYGATVTDCTGEAKISRPKAVALVATAEELASYLNAFGASGAGDNTVNLTNDIILSEAWTPVEIEGYTGAGVITINGNGCTISGLTAPLFAGGFAGASGIIIKDLTIDKSTIASNNDTGSGAFIETIDSMPVVTLENCHVKNSTITGSRTGGLIGWNAGYNNENDGPVKTYVTITGCSVVSCEITGDGSVGGIVGHAGNNAWTWNTIENCTVKDCELISTNEGGWRVGVVVGTANVGNVTISNITESGNTLTQTGKTAPEGQSSLYGRFVPGETGTLTIDGLQILAGGVTYNPDTKVAEVSNVDGVETAIAVGATELHLAEGAYSVPTSAKGKDVTFVGTGDAANTVISVPTSVNMTNAETSFENLTVKVAANASYTGLQHITKAVYKDCVIDGQHFLYGESKFENCTFNNTGDNYNVWTYGANATFENCVFNCDGKAVLVYNEGAVTDTVVFTNCKFKDNNGKVAKAAIEIAESANGNLSHHTVKINGCEVEGFNLTEQNAATFGGDSLGDKLWGNKNLIPRDRLAVYVDEIEVY